MWLVNMNKLINLFRLSIETKALTLCLVPLALMLSANVVAASAEDNGLVNHQFDRFQSQNTDGECIALPNNLSDVRFDYSGSTVVTKTTKSIFSAQPHSSWTCHKTFGDIFAGEVYIPANESITFYLNSSDGSKLWIDGSEVVTNDGVHAIQERSGSVTLTQGWHFIEVKYFHNGGLNNDDTSYSLTVSYSSTILGAKQQIPNSALRLGGALDTDNDGIFDYYDIDDDNDGLIEISTLTELDEIRNNLSGAALFGNNTGCNSGCNGFELTNDLDFDTSGDDIVDANDDYWNSGEGWQPIANTSANAFVTIFDGNNFTINHLTINLSQNDGVGLFGFTGAGANINNLSLTNTRVAGNNGVGALVGKADQTIFNNVSSTGKVTGYAEVGGLIGRMGSSSIFEANHIGHVSGTDTKIGGVIGEVVGTSSSDRLFNIGSVVGDTYVAGISGTNSGSLTNVYSIGYITGRHRVGGITASVWEDQISKMYSTAKVTGEWNIAALAPNVHGDGSSISDSYWVTGKAEYGVHSSNNPTEITEVSAAELKCPTSAGDNSCDPILFANWDDSTPVWQFGSSSQYPALSINGTTYFLGDLDNDGVNDEIDVFPSISIGVLADLDNDGAPDVCDSACLAKGLLADLDIDGDGYSDAAELACSSDPSNVNSLPDPTDTDGDSWIDCYDIDDDQDQLIEISSLAQLDLMRYDLAGETLNGKTHGCNNCYGYELVNDLDFDSNQDGVLDANDSHWNAGKGFTPIGKDTGIFTAEFNGNGYQIKNLLIKLTSGYSGGVGLFRDLGPSTTVRNLVFSGDLGEVRGRDGVGTLAGLSGGSVKNVSVNSTVTGVNYAGGIIGMMYDGKLSQVHFEGNVIGDEDVGGLIGDGFGGALIEKAYSRATVTGNNRVGAIAGSADIISAEVYWDSDLEAIGAGRVLTSDASAGQTTEELKCPTSTSDNNCSGSLYSTWVSSDWHFGTNTQLPVLAWSSLYYRDTDEDGIYDAQDPDDDNDGVNDDSDAFPFDNAESLDTDLDGIGNNADSDDDNDGFSDSDEALNATDPLLNSSKPIDIDQDFIGGLSDNCPAIFNADQANIDSDALGDVCDDSDSDSITDAEELFAGTDINNANQRPYWWKSVTARLGESAMFSLQVSEAGDVNKDGFDDVIIGARSGENSAGVSSGIAQVISGEDGSVLYQFEGQARSDFYGSAVSSAGDVNKDGFADVIVGAYKNDNTGDSAGSAYVYSGIDGALLYHFQGETAYQYFGRSVSGAGDVNNDGYADVIVGAPWDKYNWGAGVSHVYVYSGIDGTLLHKIDGFNDFDQLGYHVSELGDVNGDDKDDFLIGSKHHNVDGDPQGYSTGVVRLYSGADASVIFSLYGEEVSDRFPHSIKPTTDYNQDNIADFIVGTQGVAKKVYVFSGIDGTTIKEFTGESGTSYGGTASGIADVNNDGIEDLIVGASYTNDGNGAAHIYSGADNSELFTFHGEFENSLGQSVSTAGDLDNDGQTDIIVSSHGFDNYAGMARLILTKDIQNDNDLDYWINSGDNCVDIANADQVNSDGDMLGDACDAFINDATEWLDTDGDGTGNNTDTDDDNDGTLDVNDAFPLDNSEHVDHDGDGIGDNADYDDDNDGYQDGDEILAGTSAFDVNDIPADIDGDFVSDVTDIDNNNNDLIDIKTLADLNEIRNNLTGTSFYGFGRGCLTGCIGFELLNDLDFDTSGDGIVDSNDDYWNGGLGWNSIGKSVVGAPQPLAFSATFNGNNHTINNLTINRPDDSLASLFGRTHTGANISNLTLDKVNIIGRYYAGSLAGSLQFTVIDNVTAKGNVTARGAVGGLIGGSENSTLSQLVFVGQVSGTDAEIGGVVGFSEDDTLNQIVHIGPVTGPVTVAGIIGNGHSDLSDVFTTGKITGDRRVGGLLGYTNNTNITRAISTSNIDSSREFGALVGTVAAQISTLSSSYYLSAVAPQGIGQGNIAGSATSLSMSELTCPQNNADNACSPTIYNDWDDSTPIWSFGNNNQLPALIINGQAISNGDYDSDGVDDSIDLFPSVSIVGFIDTDGDGAPDDCDATCSLTGMLADNDDDNDGYTDAEEANYGTSPTDANDKPADEDGDSIPDQVDIDDDNDNLIEIRTLADLNEIRNNLDGTTLFGSNSGCLSSCNGFELLNDLDFDTSGDGVVDSNDDFWNGGLGWEPIGNSPNAFEAIFDGNLHKINHLFINRPVGFNIGLFGYIENQAILRNLTLDNIRVTGKDAVGGLAGLTSDSYIDVIAVNGLVNGEIRVGGIAGGTSGQSEHSIFGLTNSYHIGRVTASNGDAGGVVSQSYAGLSNVFHIGPVYGGNTVGGISAYSAYGIVNAYSAGLVSGTGYAGGIAASAYDSPLENVYSVAKVVGVGSNVGRLFGRDLSVEGVKNGYWLLEQGVVSLGLTNTTDNTQGLSIEQMSCPQQAGDANCDVAAFANWDDVTPIWDFGDSTQLPSLVINGSSYQMGDFDSDGVDDIIDLFPSVSIVGFTDTDGDGAPDNCDAACLLTGLTADEDDDNDGYLDTEEVGNTSPVITEQSPIAITIDEDNSPTAFALTLNATDIDADTLNWSINSQATNGAASVSGDGLAKAISYTPNANYHGVDSFEVQVSDNKGGTAVITVNVTINSINDPVVGTPRIYDIPQDDEGDDLPPHEGLVLDSSFRFISDDDGMPDDEAVNLVWRSNGVEVGQGEEYTIQMSDIGNTLTIEANYTDSSGYYEVAISEASEVVGNNPVDDYDNDGLTNEEEGSLGTDIHDPDFDNDSVNDSNDNYPTISLNGLADTDGDGIPDVCDAACQSLGMVVDIYPTGVIYVNDDSSCDASNTTCGDSWANAFPYLQDALTASSANTQVWVAQGIYYPDENQAGDLQDDPTVVFVVKQNMQLLGGFSDDGSATQTSDADAEQYITVLSGDISQDDTVDGNGVTNSFRDIVGLNAYSLVKDDIKMNHFTLDGFVFSGVQGVEDENNNHGNSADSAISIIHSGVTINNIKAFGNQTANGSVLFIKGNRHCTVDVNNLYAANNSSFYEGIIGSYESECSATNFTKVTLDNNHGYKGAFYIYDMRENLTFDQVSILNEDTEGSDYAYGINSSIYYGSGELVVKNSTFYRAGGIGHEYSSITVKNSTFVETNSPIYASLNEDKEFSVRSSTFVNNTSTRRSGGVYASGANVELFGNLFIGNSTDAEGDNLYMKDEHRVVDLGYNLLSELNTTNGGFANEAGDNVYSHFDSGTSFVSNEPIANVISQTLADSSGETFTLLPVYGGPAVDVMPMQICAISYDQRGQVRGYNGACDIGAVELTDNDYTDTDGDGIINDIDTDDDNDDYPDVSDDFPLNSSEWLDTDDDGEGNNADTDDDNDSVFDNDDAFPLDASESVDTDGDGIGNNSDTDDDNDGIIDELDGDPLNADIGDIQPPEFDNVVAMNANAQGRLTDISSLLEVTAFDAVDGDVTVTIVGEILYLSGQYRVLLTATDSAGNIASTEVSLTLLPEVSIVTKVNAQAGGAYQLAVNLNGNAPSYPVEVLYNLYLNDEVYDEAWLSITSGTKGEISVDVSSELTLDDNISATLQHATNAFIGDNSLAKIVLIEENIAPLLDVVLSQQGENVTVIDPDNGLVTLTAIINDVNQADSHDISWTVADNAFIDESLDDNQQTFEIDPSLLTEGIYVVAITATESNTEESLSVSQSTQFVVEQLIALGNELDSDGDGIVDSEEGYSDTDGDGIVDYLDDDSDTTRLPTEQNTEPMQTAPGLTMSLGSVVSAQGSSSNSAALTINDLAQLVGDDAADTQDNHFEVVTPVFNFTVSGLAEQGDSAAVVIPLEGGTYLPENAVYRKYNTIVGWYHFVKDENNSISSALADEHGNCPAANDDSYIQGLTAGDNCFQLIIEDGGPNDADFELNGSVEDPGAIVIAKQNTVPVLSIDAHAESYQEATIITLNSQADDSDGDSLTYTWSQISGPEVSFDSSNTASAQLTLPEVASDEVIEVQVTVSDGVLTTMSVTQFTVINKVVTGSSSDDSSSGGSMAYLLILLTLVRVRKVMISPLAA